MKTLLFSLLLLVGIGLPNAASVASPFRKSLDGQPQAVVMQRESLDSGRNTSPYVIYLDTSEIDTGHVVLDVLNAPIISQIDTVGILSFTCKDSSGADTINVIAKVQGNARCKDGGTWQNIDSTTLVMSTNGANSVPISSSYYTKTGYVVNSGGFCRLRTILRNPFTTAARKAACKDVMIVARQRAVRAN